MSRMTPVLKTNTIVSGVLRTPCEWSAADVSHFQLSLALVIHASKPEAVSLGEYIALLLSHIRTGRRNLTDKSEQRYIDGCELWQKHAESASKRVVELQERIKELEGSILTKQLLPIKRQAASMNESPIKKKGKNKEKTQATSKHTAISSLNLSHNSPSQQSVEKANLHPILTAGVKDLSLPLRVLQHATGPQTLTSAIRHACQILPKSLQQIIDGGCTEPKVVSNGTGTRASIATNIKASNQQENDLFSISQMVKNAVIEIFRSVSALNSRDKEESETWITDSTIEVALCLTELVYCVHRNTRAINAAACGSVYAAKNRSIIDLRTTLLLVVNEALRSLSYEEAFERDILEGVFYGCIRLSNHFLSNQILPKRGILDEHWLAEKAAIDESGWFILKIIEKVYPLYQDHCIGVLGRVAKRQLELAVHKLIFGKRKATREEVSEDIELINSPFTTKIFDIMGARILDTIGT